MTDKRTMLGWWEYLDTQGRELTLSEFMALMVFHEREYARKTMEMTKDQKEAAEHTEGMVGTIDEMLATTHPVYAALAQKRARPTPMLSEKEAS